MSHIGRSIAYLCFAAVSGAAVLTSASSEPKHLALVQVRAQAFRVPVPGAIAAAASPQGVAPAAVPGVSVTGLAATPTELSPITKNPLEAELDQALEVQEALLAKSEAYAQEELMDATPLPNATLSTAEAGFLGSNGTLEATVLDTVPLRPHPASWGPDHKMPEPVPPAGWGGVSAEEAQLEALLAPPTLAPLVVQALPTAPSLADIAAQYGAVEALPTAPALADSAALASAQPLYGTVEAFPSASALEPIAGLTAPTAAQPVYASVSGQALPTASTFADLAAPLSAQPSFDPVYGQVVGLPSLAAAPQTGDPSQPEFQMRKVADPAVRAWLAAEGEKLRSEAEARAQAQAPASEAEVTVGGSANVMDGLSQPNVTEETTDTSDFPVVQTLNQTMLFEAKSKQLVNVSYGPAQQGNGITNQSATANQSHLWNRTEGQ